MSQIKATLRFATRRASGIALTACRDRKIRGAEIGRTFCRRLLRNASPAVFGSGFVHAVGSGAWIRSVSGFLHTSSRGTYTRKSRSYGRSDYPHLTESTRKKRFPFSLLPD